MLPVRMMIAPRHDERAESLIGTARGMARTQRRRALRRRRLLAAEARIAAEAAYAIEASDDVALNDNEAAEHWPEEAAIAEESAAMADAEPEAAAAALAAATEETKAEEPEEPEVAAAAEETMAEEPAVAAAADPEVELEGEADAVLEAECEAAAAPSLIIAPEADLDEDPPFDPPDEDDEIFGGPRFGARATLELDVTPRPDVLLGEETKVSAGAAIAPPLLTGPQPAPPISVYASWDRVETAEIFATLAADPRMARADVEIGRGGLDGAIARFSDLSGPNVLIIDTTLREAEVLDGLDRLRGVMARGTKVIVTGGANDIRFLRDLSTRGVAEYMAAPVSADALIETLCGFYANADESRVIAVIGARGGVGASTIAHNVAWSIAERQEIGATLLDLDLAFGVTGTGFQNRAAPVDVWSAPEVMDEALLERIAAKPTRRLRILTAPGALERVFELDSDALETLIQRVRRTSPIVVLDLPHAWSGWVKQCLAAADEAVVVATPDLASLRDAKNMLDVLRAAREGKAEPRVVLSMTGAPLRPEISLKDFTQALGAAPIASFNFDPELFGLAELDGRVLGEAAPRSKAAAALDALAAELTGREPVKLRRASVPPVIVAPPEPPPPLDPELAEAFAQFGELPAPEPFDLVHEAAQAHAYLARAREAALHDFRKPKKPPPEIEAEPAPQRSRFAMWAAADMLAPIALVGALYFDGALEPSAASAAATVPAVAAAPQIDDAERMAFAIELLRVGRAEQGALLLRRAAERGYAPAQYRLAKFYEYGEGAPADLAAARLWTERAAERGHRRAMHDLGVYYARGEGAPLDEAAAYRWFRRAADLGLGGSQFNLGILYEQGRGVRADGAEALFWHLVAAAQGEAEAQSHADAIAARLTPMQVEQARARAAAFRARPIDPVVNGEPAAQEAPPAAAASR